MDGDRSPCRTPHTGAPILLLDQVGHDLELGEGVGLLARSARAMDPLRDRLDLLLGLCESSGNHGLVDQVGRRGPGLLRCEVSLQVVTLPLQSVLLGRQVGDGLVLSLHLCGRAVILDPDLSRIAGGEDPYGGLLHAVREGGLGEDDLPGVLGGHASRCARTEGLRGPRGALAVGAGGEALGSVATGDDCCELLHDGFLRGPIDGRVVEVVIEIRGERVAEVLDLGGGSGAPHGSVEHDFAPSWARVVWVVLLYAL